MADLVEQGARRQGLHSGQSNTPGNWQSYKNGNQGTYEGNHPHGKIEEPTQPLNFVCSASGLLPTKHQF